MEDNNAVIIRDLALEQVKNIEIKTAMESSTRSSKQYVVVPDGLNVRFLEEVNAKAPNEKHTFIDVDSFIKYMKCYCNATDSRLFANIDDLTLRGNIDYIPVCSIPSLAKAQDGTHTVYYQIYKTEAFKAWIDINDKNIDQSSFSAFLLEYAGCVIEPDAARMLEIATTLQIKNDVNFNSQERSSDGGYNLTYIENINAQAGGKGNKIKVPEMIKLKFVAFEGGTEMELNARLFYKLQNGNVVFRVKILNLKECILHTFKATCNKIAEDLGLDIHYTTTK